MAAIKWAEPAIDDLDAICEYISIESPLSASKLYERVFEKIEPLKKFPELGHPVPDFPVRKYRRLHVVPVYIYYRLERSTIYIIHVSRTEREVRKHLIEERAKEK